MIEVSEVYLLAQNKKKLEINTKNKMIYFTFPNYRRFYQYNQLFTSPNALNIRLNEILKNQKDTDHILLAYIASSECSYLSNQTFMSIMNRYFSQSDIYSFAQPGYENTRMVRKYAGLNGLLSERVISSELFLRCRSQYSEIGRVSIAYITDSMYIATQNGIPPLNSLIISLKSSIMKTGDDMLYNQVNKIFFIFQCDERGASFLEQCLYQVDCFYKQLKTEIRIYKKIRDKQSVASLFYLKLLIKIPIRSIVNTIRYQQRLLIYSIPIMESIRKLLVLDLWNKVYHDKIEQKENIQQYKLTTSLSSVDLIEQNNATTDQQAQSHSRKRKKHKSKQDNGDQSQNMPYTLSKSSTVILPNIRNMSQDEDNKQLSQSAGITANYSFVSKYELRKDQIKQPRRIIQADYMKILSNRVIRKLKTEFVLKTTKCHIFAQLTSTPLQNSLIKSVRRVQRGTREYMFSLTHNNRDLEQQNDYNLEKTENMNREKAMQRLKDKYGNDRHAQSLLRELRSIIFAQVDPPYPVFLNVYNLLSNTFMMRIGLGFYHTAIQILGIEFAYGGHEYNETGVYSIVPKSLAGVSFVRSIYLGHSWLSREEIADVLLQSATHWIGRDYDLVRHNCNDFTSAISLALCGQEIPNFINRAARVGKLFVKSKNIESKFADTVGFQASVDVTTPLDDQDTNKNIIPSVSTNNRRTYAIEEEENEKHQSKHKEKHEHNRHNIVQASDITQQTNGGRKSRVM